MWSFLNKFCKNFLKIKILQNSLKNICDAVFNLIKFQAKDHQLYRKETLGSVLYVEHWQNGTSEISSKNQNSSTG